MLKVGNKPLQEHDERGDPMDRHDEMDIREKKVEKREDSGMVASTFIKYAAYLIIFFGILYFLINYILPMF